jgi:hypothetical protein
MGESQLISNNATARLKTIPQTVVIIRVADAILVKLIMCVHVTDCWTIFRR